MPRASRSKAVRRHAAAVQMPSKRTFAVPEGEVTEVIIPGANVSATGDSEAVTQPSTSRIRRAERPPAAALVPSLPSHPYSRSHTRREKRKVKQQLAGGELHSIAAALSEAIGETEPPPAIRDRAAEKRMRDVGMQEKLKIGTGKGRTLGEKARRKQISLEAKRIPSIMQHPEYKRDPWATIRLHASNSVAVKDGLVAGGRRVNLAKMGGMEGVE